MIYGAIEAGGTKFVCAAADKNLNIIDKVTVETKTPEYTMEKVKEFFKKHDIVSMGIGSFGPVDIDPGSKTYGAIQNTPKTAWQDFNMVQCIKEEFDVPIIIDTDVNAAALCEQKIGCGAGKRSVLYITIGTGIGAGFVLNGKTLRGLTHPEMGHVFVKQHELDVFDGVCPYHGNCLEGLASGPAIEKRYGIAGSMLPSDHVVWDYVSDYVGQALVVYNLVLSPEVILIGGGVSRQEQIFPKIRAAFKKHMNGYIRHEMLDGDLEEYIKYPKHGQMAGLYGALQLAVQAYDER